MLEEREQYAHELEHAAQVRRQHLDHFAKLNGYLTNLTPLAEARAAAKKAKDEGNESAFLDDADGFMRLAPASEQVITITHSCEFHWVSFGSVPLSRVPIPRPAHGSFSSHPPSQHS